MIGGSLGSLGVVFGLLEELPPQALSHIAAKKTAIHAFLLMIVSAHLFLFWNFSSRFDFSARQSGLSAAAKQRLLLLH